MEARKAMASIPPGHCLGALEMFSTVDIYNFLIGVPFTMPLPRRKPLVPLPFNFKNHTQICHKTRWHIVYRPVINLSIQFDGFTQILFDSDKIPQHVVLCRDYTLRNSTPKLVWRDSWSSVNYLKSTFWNNFFFTILRSSGPKIHEAVKHKKWLQSTDKSCSVKTGYHVIMYTDSDLFWFPANVC